jgi:hypothetical protein
MDSVREMGKMVFFVGAAVAVVGAVMWLSARSGTLPLRLGRLPGDIAYQGKHGSFYFPVVTCILLSLVLTLVLWLVQWLKR